MHLAEGGTTQPAADERAAQFPNSTIAPGAQPLHHEQVPMQIPSSKITNASMSVPSHLQQSSHSLSTPLNPNENVLLQVSSKSQIHDQSSSAMNVRYKVSNSF